MAALTMPRLPTVLTTPQALAIGAVALAAWTFRTSLRAGAHFLRCGPDLLGFLEDDPDDYADFVGANPDLYLGPITPTKEQ